MSSSKARRGCLVPCCTRELAAKAYYIRYRICSYHSTLPSLVLEGQDSPVRWCQQCGRFQSLAEFDGARRTCRTKLATHNLRRQMARSRSRSLGEQAACGGTAEGDSYFTPTEPEPGPPAPGQPANREVSGGQAPSGAAPGSPAAKRRRGQQEGRKECSAGTSVGRVAHTASAAAPGAVPLPAEHPAAAKVEPAAAPAAPAQLQQEELPPVRLVVKLRLRPAAQAKGGGPLPAEGRLPLHVQQMGTVGAAASAAAAPPAGAPAAHELGGRMAAAGGISRSGQPPAGPAVPPLLPEGHAGRTPPPPLQKPAMGASNAVPQLEPGAVAQDGVVQGPPSPAAVAAAPGALGLPEPSPGAGNLGTLLASLVEGTPRNPAPRAATPLPWLSPPLGLAAAGWEGLGF